MARLCLALIALAAAGALRGEDLPIRDASFEHAFEKLLKADSFLLQNGGAKIIESDGKSFFVAVGVTSVQPDSPGERMRQLRVGKIQALKLVAEFTSETKVSTSDEMTETTAIKNKNGVKSGTSSKVYEERILAQIRTVLNAPPQVGAWKSPDGQIFFYAIGIELK